MGSELNPVQRRERAHRLATEFCDPDTAMTRTEAIVRLRMGGQGALADALEEAVEVSREFLRLEQQAAEWARAAGQADNSRAQQEAVACKIHEVGQRERVLHPHAARWWCDTHDCYSDCDGGPCAAASKKECLP